LVMPSSIAAASARRPTSALFFQSPEDSKPSPDIINPAEGELITDITRPHPDLNALSIVTHCMDSLHAETPQKSLEVCFDFASDQCRAAVGGSLDAFIDYANNPVFGTMVHCDSFQIISVGPLIAGGKHRGAMQTVLVEINKGITVNDALQTAVKKDAKKRPGRLSMRKQLAEEERQRHENGDAIAPPQDDPNRRRFLWTLQQARRPPRQDCWLVHEVLFMKNAYELTL